MQSHTFDRLQATRRNRKLRNICAIVAGIAGAVATVLAIDPAVSNEPLKPVPLLITCFIFFLGAGMSVYFHMRFISRD